MGNVPLGEIPAARAPCGQVVAVRDGENVAILLFLSGVDVVYCPTVTGPLWDGATPFQQIPKVLSNASAIVNRRQRFRLWVKGWLVCHCCGAPLSRPTGLTTPHPPGFPTRHTGQGFPFRWTTKSSRLGFSSSPKTPPLGLGFFAKSYPKNTGLWCRQSWSSGMVISLYQN